ncbi:hypothetical protein RND81_13G065100 [Saponaria officinalis]|uniref:Replication protein A 70 kDa DNA-binding subunit B/D first OB fold domain-containing protein n=1 Tax=Saponaria officinalis TaxID=3572 RepID=A0AAW1GUM7_SAPOF
MATAPFLTISQLTVGVRLTQMNVRVIHKWTRPDLKEKGKIGSIELLLLDAENEVIQATIAKQLVSYFGPKFTVGEVYTIRNLTVDSNIGLDKATSNPCRLKFLFSSKVQVINDTSIPLHDYRFADFEDILNGKVATTHYIGQWRVQTTFNVTVFHVNPDIPEVKQFEQSFSTPSASNSLQVIDIPDDDDHNVLTTENIKSICDIKQHEKKGLYYTLATVVDVDCNASWYYDSCKICWAKAVKNDNGRWICTRDGRDGKISGLSSSIPRFQVKFVVSDASKEEADFVVFDSQITQFISHSASDLLAKLEKDGEMESIPRELEAFVDKTFVFKINIHEKFNICQGSNSYTVYSMSDDAELADKWHAKYTQLFKEDFDSFKSSTKGLAVHVENVKFTVGGSSENLTDHNIVRGSNVSSHQDEESETAETSPKITPLKRSYPCPDAISGKQHDMNVGTRDATSATKKLVIVKKEKNLSHAEELVNVQDRSEFEEREK